MQAADARFYADFHGLSSMKAGAAVKDDATIDEVARQFESLLLQMMLKSMRDASLGESLLDSEKGMFYRDLYDKQLAMDLSRSGGLGLADIIKRQLGGAQNDAATPGRRFDDYQALPIDRPAAPAAVPGAASAGDRTTTVRRQSMPGPAVERPSPATDIELDGNPERFVRELWPLAQQAATELGLSTEALLAQAALETGWGGRMIRDGGGNNSHNLFGIKADRRWPGERARVATLEFESGVAVRKRADFRAYDSYAQSFADYVDLIKASPRYQEALGVAEDSKAYFKALQQAGYATDPKYADKIERILSSEPLRDAALTSTTDDPPRSPTGA